MISVKVNIKIFCTMVMLSPALDAYKRDLPISPVFESLFLSRCSWFSLTHVKNILKKQCNEGANINIEPAKLNKLKMYIRDMLTDKQFDWKFWYIDWCLSMHLPMKTFRWRNQEQKTLTSTHLQITSSRVKLVSRSQRHSWANLHSWSVLKSVISTFSGLFFSAICIARLMGLHTGTKSTKSLPKCARLLLPLTQPLMLNLPTKKGSRGLISKTSLSQFALFTDHNS